MGTPSLMGLSMLTRMSIAGYLTVVTLLVCSFVMVALVVDFRKRTRELALDGEWLLSQIRYLLFTKRCSSAVVCDYLQQLNRPPARICSELLILSKPSLEAGDYILSTVVEKERMKLESGLAHLGTIAVIAPFVGLFGTVVGITKTFADVAQMGKAGIEVVSAGVSEALVATAIGLLVAILSVILFNHFKKAFERLAAEWDLTGRSLLSLILSPEEDRERLLQGPAPPPTDSAQKYLSENVEG